MSELSFLIELLLNHELKKETKDIIADRIREVGSNLSKLSTYPTSMPLQPVQHEINAQATMATKQAPSTLALMAKHGDIPATEVPQVYSHPVEKPVEVVAQNAITAKALQHRQEAISEALSGKIDKVAGRPRKW